MEHQDSASSNADSECPSDPKPSPEEPKDGGGATANDTGKLAEEKSAKETSTVVMKSKEKWYVLSFTEMEVHIVHICMYCNTYVNECRPQPGVHDQPWEPSLTDSELKILEELGLGVAVDITAKHPWAKKSAFQAKSLSNSNIERNDLIVINESNQFLRTSEQVETYTEVQAGLESSFRPDPSMSINVNIAADFHRSNTRSKTIKGTTVLTRTVAFRAKDPTSKIESKEEFENQLHKWLVRKGCVKCHNEANADGHPNQCSDCDYSSKTNHYCIDYLRELGGVTHYVSSITLGATKYQVTLNSTLFQSISTSSGIGVDSFVSGSTKCKASKKVFQLHSKEQQIGKIPQHDSTNLKEFLQFRTKGEAVVKCSYNSLANLVSHPQLRAQLELGIQEYIDFQKNGTRKLL